MSRTFDCETDFNIEIKNETSRSDAFRMLAMETHLT